MLFRKCKLHFVLILTTLFSFQFVNTSTAHRRPTKPSFGRAWLNNLGNQLEHRSPPSRREREAARRASNAIQERRKYEEKDYANEGGNREIILQKAHNHIASQKGDNNKKRRAGILFGLPHILFPPKAKLDRVKIEVWEMMDKPTRYLVLDEINHLRDHWDSNEHGEITAQKMYEILVPQSLKNN